ncbi:Endoplasmic reticulum aminopeptidase 2 [Manis javanica]|nr:Endoplasmic reticulum aminopeptidase 2 [Manis javanica]
MIELEGGLLEDHFETTVKMSTYLVAYIVCDFKSVSGTTSSGVKVSIYTAPDKWSQMHYALETSMKLLDFYENYFDINYPLPKLDRFKFHVIAFIFTYRTFFDFFPS